MAISLNNALGNIPTQNSRSDNLLQQLSSGQRINSAADDAAGAAISERLSSQLSGFDATRRNAGDSISALQVADGALSSINNNISRIQELTIQAGNGTLSQQDRQALQAEANLLIEDSNRLLETSNFNGKPLLNSEEDFSVQLSQAGETIQVQTKNVAEDIRSLGFNAIDLSSQGSASEALDVLNQTSELITTRQSELGASSNRISSAIDNIESSKINTAEARSRISDTDYAQVASDLAASQIRDQVQAAILGQANSQGDSVLRLLS